MRIFIADAAISLVPREWLQDKSVKKYYQKYGRYPIIDGSKYQHLLQGVPLTDRKDRPDILHFGLLTALGYVDLVSDLEIFFSCDAGLFSVDADVALPRSQIRFYGILEQLLADTSSSKHIHPQPEKLPGDFGGKTVYFSRSGGDEISEALDADTFVFGGFAHGTFEHTIPSAVKIISLSSIPLDLWTSISLVINHVNNTRYFMS